MPIGWPFHRTCPEVGASSRARARKKTLLPDPEEPVMDTRSPAFKVKSVGWSKGTWRRSSMRVRARVSISALMDAGFLSIRLSAMVPHGLYGVKMWERACPRQRWLSH